MVRSNGIQRTQDSPEPVTRLQVSPHSIADGVVEKLRELGALGTVKSSHITEHNILATCEHGSYQVLMTGSTKYKVPPPLIRAGKYVVVNPEFETKEASGKVIAEFIQSLKSLSEVIFICDKKNGALSYKERDNG